MLSDALLELGRARLVDSIIGPKSRVRLNSGNYSLILGEGNSIISTT